MQVKLKQIQQEIISQFQLERDQATIDYLKLKECYNLQKKLIYLNDFVDFNAPIVLPHIMPLLINLESINFLLKHHTEIKRKFTITELIQFGDMYRLVRMFGRNIESLAELKRRYSKIRTVKECINH